MVIYKNYNQEALDKQYNNRAMVPNFAQIVEQWMQQSADTRKRATIHLDLPYGPHKRERLDIFPAESANAPVQVFFHGGYWKALEKEVFHFIANGFIDNGVTTALVNYPLVPQVTMDDLVNACQRAVTWIYHNIANYNGDPDKIYTSGHSAGGHIVAMLTATNWSIFDVPQNIIKGGCAISGLFNLLPIQLCYLNDELSMDKAAARRNSPVFLSPACSTPLIVTVGQRESDEYHAQTRELIDVWSAKGITFTHLPIPNANHFSILDSFVDNKAPLNQAILNQMEIIKAA